MNVYKEKSFLEFSIEGVIRVDSEDKEAVINELTKLLTKALKSRDLIKIDTNITVLSESDIMFAMHADPYYNDN